MHFSVIVTALCRSNPSLLGPSALATPFHCMNPLKLSGTVIFFLRHPKDNSKDLTFIFNNSVKEI